MAHLPIKDELATVLIETARLKALLELQIVYAKTILMKGLQYHEHDGHNMPKKVAREALETLGIPRDRQP